MNHSSPPTPYLLLLLAAYVLGCVNAGYYLVRFRVRADVRQAGSGSTGATNVARLLGWRGFATTLLLDAGKGALAVGLARFAVSDPMASIGALVAVVAGHVWPVQLRFRGGKGIAPYLGALIALDPAMALTLAVVALIGYGLSRAYQLAGLGAVAGMPLVAWGFHLPLATVTGLGIAGLIIIIAHRVNLREEIGKFISPDKPRGGGQRTAKRP